MELLPGRVRSKLSKRALRWTAVVAAFAVAVSLTVVTVVPGSRPGPTGPGSPAGQRALSQYPWWNPRGGVNDRSLPASRTLPGTGAGLPAHQRMPRRAVVVPARRGGELVTRRSEFCRGYQLSDGRRQTVISAAPVNYRDASGRWQPIDTTGRPSTRPGFAYGDTSDAVRSFFGTHPGRRVRFEAPGGGWLEMSLDGAHAGSPRTARNTVSYPGVERAASLEYQVTPNALNESIILASPSAPATYSYTVTVGGGLVPWQRR